MNIFHYYPTVLPVKKYRGTERIAINLITIEKPIPNFESYIPEHIDIIQLYSRPQVVPRNLI